MVEHIAVFEDLGDELLAAGTVFRHRDSGKYRAVADKRSKIATGASVRCNREMEAAIQDLVLAESAIKRGIGRQALELAASGMWHLFKSKQNAELALLALRMFYNANGQAEFLDMLEAVKQAGDSPAEAAIRSILAAGEQEIMLMKANFGRTKERWKKERLSAIASYHTGVTRNVDPSDPLFRRSLNKLNQIRKEEPARLVTTPFNSKFEALGGLAGFSLGGLVDGASKLVGSVTDILPDPIKDVVDMAGDALGFMHCDVLMSQAGQYVTTAASAAMGSAAGGAGAPAAAYGSKFATGKLKSSVCGSKKKGEKATADMPVDEAGEPIHPAELGQGWHDKRKTKKYKKHQYYDPTSETVGSNLSSAQKKAKKKKKSLASASIPVGKATAYAGGAVLIGAVGWGVYRHVRKQK